MSATVIILCLLYAAEPEVQEGWVTHTVRLAPDCQTVVYGRFHNENGTSQLVVRSGPDQDRATREIEYRGIMRAADFSPDGRWLAAGTLAGKTGLWKTHEWPRIAELKLQKRWTVGIAFAPNCHTFATIGSDGTVALADAASRKILWRKESERVATAVRFSPDGESLAVSFSSGRIDILRSRDGTIQKTLQCDSSFPMCVAFSPDGKLLVAGCWNHTVQTWDLETRRIVVQSRRHTQRVRAVAVSADGRYAATASDDRSIILWKIDTLTPKHQWSLPEGLVGDLRFAPDGKTVVGARFDGQIWRGPVDD